MSRIATLLLLVACSASALAPHGLARLPRASKVHGVCVCVDEGLGHIQLTALVGAYGGVRDSRCSHKVGTTAPSTRKVGTCVPFGVAYLFV